MCGLCHVRVMFCFFLSIVRSHAHFFNEAMALYLYVSLNIHNQFNTAVNDLLDEQNGTTKMCVLVRLWLAAL